MGLALGVKMATTQRDKWEDNYRRLLRFVEREGHCRVPARYEEDGIRLGRWVCSQREKRNLMPQEYRQALEDVNGWYWNGQQAKWDHAAFLLDEYVAREGHAVVPARHVEGDFHLGRWVWHLRGDHRRGTLSKKRRVFLERYEGWIWDATEAPVTVGSPNKKKRS